MEIAMTPFRLEGEYITSILNNIRTRPVSWTSFVRTNCLNENNSETLKTLTNINDQEDPKNRGNAISLHTDIYAKVLLSTIDLNLNNNKNNNNKNDNGTNNRAAIDNHNNNDLVKIILTLLYDGLGYIKTNNFNKTLTYQIIKYYNNDKQLIYKPFTQLLNENKDLTNDDNIIISILSCYIITILLTTTDYYDNEKVELVFNFINNKLISSNNSKFQFLGLQFLKELLSVKTFKNIYIKDNSQTSNSNLISLNSILLNKSIELQMKYITIYSLWTLTFDPKITNLLVHDSNFSEIIPTLFNYSNDAVKEKIVRLSISILINILNNSSSSETVKLLIIKKYLLSNGLNIIKNLIDRKWSDDDLKDDLNNLYEILNDSIKSLTTFDEYENEISTKRLIWSPCHKNQEFWFDNIDKFRENNWKLVKVMIKLLNDETISNDQLYLNQSIVCYDLSMLIKICPEIIRIISSLGIKTKIMTLMNSPNANVKFEALRTTQLLVGNSF